MIQIRYKDYELPFEHPFAIAKGLKTVQPTLLVSLSFGRITGFGEATAIHYYNTDIQSMVNTLQQKQSIIEKYAFNDPKRFWHYLHHLIPNQQFLQSALDIAGWDMWGKLQQKPLWKFWINELPTQLPQTAYTIGINSEEEIIKRIKEKPYPIYKIKSDGTNDRSVLQIISENTNAAIMIDANESWKLDYAISIADTLNRNNILLIEQPFQKQHPEWNTEFKKHIDIPIIADEACIDLNDTISCLHYYDGINIKLAKCGGITPALEIIDKIKSNNKMVMLGGMCESFAGATALAHLLPFADFADIDGPLLLKENVGAGISYQNANIQLPQSFGSGFHWGK